MEQGLAKKLFIAAICFSEISLALSATWSYEGPAGPDYWHELFPDACSGPRQSPIDIKAEETMYNPNLKDFAIWYDPPKRDSKMYIKNNGHTLQVDLQGEFYVSNGGLSNVYKAAQFHFHWGHKVHSGSEHLIEGKASPIEMHLVTYNSDLFDAITEAVTKEGGLAVLGVMFEATHEDNPVLEPIIKAIKHIRDPEDRARISLPLISLRELMPEDMSRYYRYNGSLTTPGCFESVTWTVFDTKQTISHRQLKEFRTLLQFRRKHGARHRRSLSRAQKRMERAAEGVLDELGIRGDQVEEDILKAELTKKNSDHEVKSHTSTPSDPSYEHALPSEQVVVEVVEEYTQDILVNNYRPVQPLNNRVVFRSFKLKDPPMQVEVVNQGAEVENTGAAQDQSYGRGRNGASSIGGGLLAGLCCFLMSFLLAL